MGRESEDKVASPLKRKLSAENETKPKKAVKTPKDVTLNVIGFGSVGNAFNQVLPGLIAKGELPSEVKAVRFWAPEFKEYKKNGLVDFNPSPMVTKDTYIKFLDDMKLVEGDLVIELGTRISTRELWNEVKRRGCHFLNTGFDTWADQELDMSLVEGLTKHPDYVQGSGTTSVFSCGFNPGVISHFVAHGLTAATGIQDTKKASAEFGLCSISLIERDSQAPKIGSEQEKFIKSTYQDVCYNTWSPGNYVVECAESPIWFECMPKEAGKYKASEPSVLSWMPDGPLIGNVIPHDETFTIQSMLDKQVPCAFIYEAPPAARGYVKSNQGKHVDSNHQKADLLRPKKHDLDHDGYDYLGALLKSNKPGVAPFWCGASLNVGGALALDKDGTAGPTSLQVIGGLWSAITFVLQNKNAGECQSEDLPTSHVIKTCFPLCGQLVCRSAPESAGLVNVFDPAGVDQMNILECGMPDAKRVEVKESQIHGKGTFAAVAMNISTLASCLPTEPAMDSQIGESQINHSCNPNAYVDRHWNVRTSKAVEVGEEITIDYSTLLSENSKLGVGTACNCKSDDCRKTIGAEMSKEQFTQLIQNCPVITDLRLRKVFETDA